MDWPRNFAAEGGLKSHKCCYGLLCVDFVISDAKRIGFVTEALSTSWSLKKFLQSLKIFLSQFIIHGCERQHKEHLSSADTINANLQAVQAG